MPVSPPLNPIMMVLEGNGSLAGRDRAGAFTATGSGALRYAPAPGARVNYVPTPLTGNSVSGWLVNGVATIAPSTDWSSSGAYSGKLTIGTVGISTATYSTFASSSPGFIRLQPSGQYTYTFKVYNPQLSLRSVGVFWRSIDLAGNPISNLASKRYVTVPAQSEMIFTGTATVPSGASGCQLYVYADSSGTYPFADGEILYISDVRVNDGPADLGPITNPIWLDPATGQLGTPHASPSVSRAQFWVEEATTNLIINPSAEAATTYGATAQGVGATLTKDTTVAYMGAASYKVACDGTNPAQGLFISTDLLTGTTARTFTGSVYVRGSGTVYVWVRAAYSDSTQSESTYVPITLTGAWQRVIVPPFTTTAGKTISALLLMVRTQGTQVATIFADCAQMEEKAYATSYCDGSLGTGYTWAGTAHASASTRAAALVTDNAAASHIDYNSSATALRSTIPTDQGNFISHFLATGGYGVGDFFGTSVNYSGTKKPRVRNKSGAAAEDVTFETAGTFSVGTSHNLYLGYTPTTRAIELDGAGLLSTSRTAPVGLITVLSVGGGSTESINGYIGPVAIYNAPLSDARRTMVNAAIDSNGATDLWTLFEEWEGVLSPFDLFDLEAIEATVGVVAEFAPLDLFELDAGAVSSGVSAIMEPIDFGLDYEDLRGVSVIPLPASIGWEDASSPLVTWSTD